MFLDLLDLPQDFLFCDITGDSHLLVVVVYNDLINSWYIEETVLDFLFAMSGAALRYAELHDRDHIAAVRIATVDYIFLCSRDPSCLYVAIKQLLTRIHRGGEMLAQLLTPNAQ